MIKFALIKYLWLCKNKYCNNVKELPNFIDFVKSLKNEKVILKLICFNLNNPAQLEEKGKHIYEQNNVSF